DVPEPALLVGCLDDKSRAFVPAGVAVSALPVGPDGAFVEHGIPEPQLEAILEHGALAARIDDDLGADNVLRAVFTLDAGGDGAVVFEEYVEHARRFMDFDALFGGVAQHHEIELAAHHLPGLRALVWLVVPEVEGRRQLAARIDELHAELLDEMARFHLVEHLQSLEHPIRFVDEGFADMEAWKALALAEDNLGAVLSEEGGASAAGGTAADDEHVCGLGHGLGHRVLHDRALVASILRCTIVVQTII